MGLDQYAFVRKGKIDAMVDFGHEEGDEELAYWRKHPNLHGWMEQLYRQKNGEATSFNCVPVVLTAEDLDDLEAAITSKALPQTSGFFFGASDGSEFNEDLAFVAKAREAIAAGNSVYYDSWW